MQNEKTIIKKQVINEGKPENIADKIVNGKIEKYYKENCLLEQEYIRDSNKTIDSLLREMITKLGENIIIKRFARFEIGE